MLRCGNGTSRSFSCARSCRAVRTRATEFRSRGWPVCPRKFSIAQKTFSRTSKIRTAQSLTPNQNAKDQRKTFLNRKSRSWICCELLVPGGTFAQSEGLSRKSQEFTFQYCTCNTGMLTEPTAPTFIFLWDQRLKNC